MPLTKSEISFLKNKNLLIENAILTNLSTGKTYPFDEIKKLELKIHKSEIEFKPNLFQRLFPFMKFIDFKYLIKRNEIRKKANIYLILKNNSREHSYSNTSFDLITIAKIIGKINLELRQSWKRII